MNVLNSAYSVYTQILTDSMILTSYSEKSYLPANFGGYVESVQMMSHDTSKHQLSQQFVARQKYSVARHEFHVALQVTLNHVSNTHQCCNTRIISFTTSEVLVHVTLLYAAIDRYIIKHLFHKYRSHYLEKSSAPEIKFPANPQMYQAMGLKF